MKLVQYVEGLINAGLGRNLEGFTDSKTPVSKTLENIPSSIQKLYTSIPILFILHAGAMFVYGLGAARLSYCYQMNTNPSSYMFYMYILLAFVFSPMYYPFYGIFLNPLCSVQKNKV